MITKEQAINAHEFHWGECVRTIGPKGGVKEKSERWRRNGRTQTWVTRPNDFRIPVKLGLYAYNQVTHLMAPNWHTAEDCVPCAGSPSEGGSS